MSKGFTLIELMIVVVIMGLLATIAYPSYVEHVAKARRVDAQTALLDLSQRMERYYSDNHTYTGATVNGLLGTTTSLENWYALTANIPAGGASYTLTATAAGAQANNDPGCASLSITNTGIKSSTQQGGNASNNCW